MKVLNSKLFWICMMLPLVVFAVDVSPATPEDELDESEDIDDLDEEEGALGPWSANNGTDLSEYGDSYENEDDLQPGETEEDEEDDDQEGGLDRRIRRRALRPEGARCRRLRRRVCQRGLYCKMYRICTTLSPCSPGTTCPKRCRRRGVCTRRNPSSTTAQSRTTTRRARRRTRRTTTPIATTKAGTTRRRTTPKA